MNWSDTRPLSQNIPDFRKQLDVGRQLRRLSRVHLLILATSQPVHGFHDDEEDPGNNDEFRVIVTKLPQASTAPCLLASASVVAVTPSDKGMK